MGYDRVLRAALNPAGGIRYHLRARRHRSRTWAPFRAAVAEWLAGWDPGTPSLAIVGPSGGHCLPEAFLARFDRLLCFEPDPLARLIFTRRVRRIDRPPEIRWITDDAWISPLLAGRGAPRDLLPAGTALLFANFLGQTAFLVPDDDWWTFRAAWRSSVWPLLARVPWASFHDRVSGTIAPRLSPGMGGTAPLDDAAIVALYGDQAGELLDHRATELLPPGRDYAYFDWPLVPGRHHLVESMRGGPARDA